MLAAHRDQENLVHSHQVPSKQHPKTPGAKHPKTPSKFGRNDENMPTAFAGKNGAAGGIRTGGNDKILTTKPNGNRQAMMTPLESRIRAPLGNKTTNAKARAGPAGVGVKDMVKEIEKTQAKATTTQRPKQKQSTFPPLQIEPEADRVKEQDDEPEYAPPRPADLPYESDLLPTGGLTFKGLKRENLFNGFYEHFYDPVDDNGVSRREKRFKDEMKAVVDQAEERNRRDMEALHWGISTTTEARPAFVSQNPDPPAVAESKMAQKVRSQPGQKRPGTITSRKAASALAIHADNKRTAAPKPVTTGMSSRRPLSSLIPGQRKSNSTMPSKTESVSNAMGEAASRTTIGYSKGKSASSMIRKPVQDQARLEHRPKKLPAMLDDEHDLTITPARVHQSVSGTGLEENAMHRPLFMTIFDQEEEEDLPPMAGPNLGLGDEGDEDEDFQLKLDL